MSCLLSQRVKPVHQCGTYNLFLFGTSTQPVEVIFENVARERSHYFTYTPQTILKDGTNMSYVTIDFDDYGHFLNSDSDFNVSVERDGTVVLIYLGVDEDSEAILADSIIAKFKELYNSSNEKGQIIAEDFKL